MRTKPYGGWRVRDRGFAVVALGGLLVSDALLRCVPFRRLSMLVGTLGGESPADAALSHKQTAARVGRAVAVASRRLPHHPRCLAQALTTQVILRLLRIPGTVVLGVRRDEELDVGLAAHAWVRVGDAIVVGRDGHQRFTIVGSFAAERKS